jgi:hypothetical protein
LTYSQYISGLFFGAIIWLSLALTTAAYPDGPYSLLPQVGEVYIQDENGKPAPCVEQARDLAGKLNAHGMVRGFKTYIRNGRERAIVFFLDHTSLIIARDNGVYCKANLAQLDRDTTLRLLRDIYGAKGN